MYDRPDPDEQLDAVAEFLRQQVMPKLDGQLAFHVRVAANMIDIVRRQQQLAPDAQAHECARLRKLLGDGAATSETGADIPLADMNRELCRRIADGRLTLDSPGLTDHLWRITLDKLAVDQPRYETYLRLLASAKKEDA